MLMKELFQVASFFCFLDDVFFNGEYCLLKQAHALYNFGPLSAYLAINFLDRFLSAYELPVSILLLLIKIYILIPN